LDKLVAPHLNRPVGRPPNSGIQVKVVDLQYQAKSWHKPRRVVAKIEWHQGELFPRIGFVVTNSRLPAAKVVKVYNGRAEIENRIKEGKNTLRWDKTSCQRFEAKQPRLKMGVLAYNLLHMIRQFYVWGEEVKRSIDWLIKRLIKVGARISYHARRWYVHVASAFSPGAPLPSGACLGSLSFTTVNWINFQGLVCPDFLKNYSFSEICAIKAPARQVGIKRLRLP
jgi:hypothetical protein